ncbi:MAG: DUF167 domain-containing protein [Alphaproteobacteria bacterium]|nr:DUF167 domain-containing protein [Alphaproteobacteria bacterium]MBQ2810841.1 DUF167 domain-containing protein [Alphaproteobacteria bacterium]
MFFTNTQKGYVLRVRLTPNSSCCKILGTTVDANEDVFLKISVVSVPEKGKANKELISFLAKKLKIAKSDFEIVSGELDKWKKIRIISDKLKDDDLLNLAENK